jgi:large subunit ribosomal protein L10
VEKPELKAAFVADEIYLGDNQLANLVKIKTKNELIGDVIGLLQSPAKRVIAALLEKGKKEEAGVEAPAAE